MNLENIKVREVSAPEKGKAEIEQELLDKSALQTENTIESDKAPEVEKKEENNVELTDSSVKDYLEKRYNKSIDSFEDLLKEREEQPELPEDVSSFLKYKKETGRGINDYVKLNRDFEEMQPDNLLAEYFLATDEAIDSEDVDDAQVIKKRKLAKKRAVVKARKYFNEQKEQYKQPLESRTVASSNNSEELKAYKQFAESAKSKEETARKNSEVFQQKTKEVFSNEFKGFEFKVGDKDVTYSPGDVSELLSKQSNVMNFINKFMDSSGQMNDAYGYHRALSLAMNPEKFAKFFYEQGQSDGVTDVVRKTKNINMKVRNTPEVGTTKGGMRVRALNTDSGRGLKIKSVKRK